MNIFLIINLKMIVLSANLLSLNIAMNIDDLNSYISKYIYLYLNYF